MRPSGKSVAVAFVMIGFLTAMFPSAGFAAKMTREQARIACRNDPERPWGRIRRFWASSEAGPTNFASAVLRCSSGF